MARLEGTFSKGIRETVAGTDGIVGHGGDPYAEQRKEEEEMEEIRKKELMEAERRIMDEGWVVEDPANQPRRIQSLFWAGSVGEDLLGIPPLMRQCWRQRLRALQAWLALDAGAVAFGDWMAVVEPL